MKHATPNIALGVILAVAGSMAQTAYAQESWGGQGSASSWQTGSAKSTVTPAVHIATGGESSWGAGKGSIPTRGAPGGVWSDGTAFHAAAVQSLGAKTAVGVSSLAKPVGLASLGTVSSRSHYAGAPGKGQTAGRSGQFHAATGPKGTSGPQFGLKKMTSGVRRTSRGRSGAISGGGHFGASSRSSSTAPGQGLESPMQNGSELSGSSGSTSNSTPSLEPRSSLGSSSH